MSEETDAIAIHIKSGLAKAVLSKIISSVIKKKIDDASITIRDLDMRTNQCGDIHGRVTIDFDVNIKDVMEALNQ